MNRYQEPFDVDSIPTPVLLKAAQERKRQAKEKTGPWSVLQKLEKCPYCRRKCGVRERIAHRQLHNQGKPCPTERVYYRR